jgi:AcrR family transcriptional regulator
LLAAARKEFAEHGIAGARVDRIAAESGSNKAQIYHYFGSKDNLFNAVVSGIVAQIVEDTPIDVADLPGYAERLARGCDEQPDVMRLVTWSRLERGDKLQVQAVLESNKEKIARIEQAQADGLIPVRYPAGVLLALILQISALWSGMSVELAAVVGDLGPAARASFVRDAVSVLVASKPVRSALAGKAELSE